MFPFSRKKKKLGNRVFIVGKEVEIGGQKYIVRRIRGITGKNINLDFLSETQISKAGE